MRLSHMEHAQRLRIGVGGAALHPGEGKEAHGDKHRTDMDVDPEVDHKEGEQRREVHALGCPATASAEPAPTNILSDMSVVAETAPISIHNGMSIFTVFLVRLPCGWRIEKKTRPSKAHKMLLSV